MNTVYIQGVGSDHYDFFFGVTCFDKDNGIYVPYSDVVDVAVSFSHENTWTTISVPPISLGVYYMELKKEDIQNDDRVLIRVTVDDHGLTSNCLYVIETDKSSYSQYLSSIEDSTLICKSYLETTSSLIGSLYYALLGASGEITVIPSATSSLVAKINALFQYFFYKRDVSKTEMKLYKNDDTTVLGVAPVSDNKTSTTKGKVV